MAKKLNAVGDGIATDFQRKILLKNNLELPTVVKLAQNGHLKHTSRRLANQWLQTLKLGNLQLQELGVGLILKVHIEPWIKTLWSRSGGLSKRSMIRV